MLLKNIDEKTKRISEKLPLGHRNRECEGEKQRTAYFILWVFFFHFFITQMNLSHL